MVYYEDCCIDCGTSKVVGKYRYIGFNPCVLIKFECGSELLVDGKGKAGLFVW